MTQYGKSEMKSTLLTTKLFKVNVFEHIRILMTHTFLVTCLEMAGITSHTQTESSIYVSSTDTKIIDDFCNILSAPNLSSTSRAKQQSRARNYWKETV